MLDINPLCSISLYDQLSRRELSHYLTEEQIYTEIYGTKDIKVAEDTIKDHANIRGECGKLIEHGAIAWSCPVCRLDSSSIICQECYNPSQHEGHHEYIRKDIKSGRCDCGDSDAWTITGSCSKHAKDLNDESKISPKLLPESMTDHAIDVINKLIDALNTFSLELGDELEFPNKTFVRFKVVNDLKWKIDFISRILSHLFETN